MMQTEKFLRALQGEGAYNNFWHPIKGTRWFRDPGELEIPTDADWYVGVNPCRDIPPVSRSGNTNPKWIRGQEEYIECITHLFSELDVGKPPREGGKIFKSLDEILEYLETLPKATWIIFSGHGYHVYHALTTPFYITDELTLLRAKEAQANWVKYMGGDPGSKDIARVLRIPGTINAKSDPHMGVTIVQHNDVSYTLEQLEEVMAGETKIPDGSHYAEMRHLGAILRNDGHDAEAIAVKLWEFYERECEKDPNEDIPKLKRNIQKLGEWFGARPVSRPTREDPPAAKREEKIAEKMVRLAEELEIELFRTSEGQGYAKVPVGDHFETLSVQSVALKRWMQHEYRKRNKKTPSRTTAAEAVDQLEGIALFDGEVRPVFTRVGYSDGAWYIDLANDKWQAVAITGKEWKIVDNPPVCFARGAGMDALPMPIGGGNLSQLLLPFLNVSSMRDLRLFIAWLMAALTPTGPYPMLSFVSEHGSCKSTMTRVARALTDPNTSPLRTLPRNDRNLYITARNSHVIAFDNVSKLADWQSDSLCRMATGGGFSTRGLWTNDDEYLFTATRPVIINGITDYLTRGDLLDRSIPLMLPEVPPNKRRLEGEFFAEFEKARPYIFGALLDAISMARDRLPHTTMAENERMADFCLFMTAAETGLGWRQGSFMQAYKSSRQDVDSLALESSAAAVAMTKFVKDLNGEPWEGTMTALLGRLAEKVTAQAEKSRDWPKNAAILGGELNRLAPTLRNVGIHIKKYRTKKAGRIVRISSG